MQPDWVASISCLICLSGMADPSALPQAVSAFQACHFIGMPECEVGLGDQSVMFGDFNQESYNSCLHLCCPPFFRPPFDRWSWLSVRSIWHERPSPWRSIRPTLMWRPVWGTTKAPCLLSPCTFATPPPGWWNSWATLRATNTTQPSATLYSRSTYLRSCRESTSSPGHHQTHEDLL